MRSTSAGPLTSIQSELGTASEATGVGVTTKGDWLATGPAFASALDPALEAAGALRRSPERQLAASNEQQPMMNQRGRVTCRV